MKGEGHLKKAREIKASVELLKGDEQHLVAVVELCYGMAQHIVKRENLDGSRDFHFLQCLKHHRCFTHLIAYALEERFAEHRDTHQGTPALLREKGLGEIAVLFERLDTLRHGRWYGGKGNGEVLDETLEIIEEIEGWALE